MNRTRVSEIDQNWPANNGCGAYATPSIDSGKTEFPPILRTSRQSLGSARVSG